MKMVGYNIHIVRVVLDHEEKMSRLEEIIGVEIIQAGNDEIRLGHTFYEVDVLKSFIKKECPDWFVEIGVHEGGLSWLLIPELPKVNYLGIELSCVYVRTQVINLYAGTPNADLLCRDVFDWDVIQRISKLARKIIYCDGGNKVKELKTYKNACKSGDIIMAHDFSDGIREVRDVPDYFLHPEVYPADIKHLDEDEDFERLPEKPFVETRIVGWRKK